LSCADDAKRLSVVLAAPHRHLAECQRHSNYTHRQVIWASGLTIRLTDPALVPAYEFDQTVSW
jgi:hypothetical protein